MYEIAFMKELDKYIMEKSILNHMAKRVTIMVDDDLDKKLRLYQAKQISKTNTAVSYSKVINDLLRKEIK